MSIIQITVDHQELFITDAPKVASESVNSDYILFTFSSDWDGFGKTANFYRESDPETVYSAIVDQNGYAAIPYAVTAFDGKIYLGVSGVSGEVVKTSELLKYRIVRGLYVAEVDPPEPGIYEQMLTAIGAAQNQQTEFTRTITQQQTATNELAETTSARMDAFIATQSGVSNGTLITRTNLFSSHQTPITDSENAAAVIFIKSNYDELEIRYRNYIGQSTVRIATDDIDNRSNDTSADANFLYDPRCHIDSFALVNSGYDDRDSRPILKTSFVLWYDTSTNALKWTTKYWLWDGKNSTDATSTFAPSENRIGITKIVAIKYTDAGTDKDAELVDLRIGANGETYSSAGVAVRTQFQAIANSFTDPNDDGNIVIDMGGI